jgi:hypothetical protein
MQSDDDHGRKPEDEELVGGRAHGRQPGQDRGRELDLACVVRGLGAVDEREPVAERQGRTEARDDEHDLRSLLAERAEENPVQQESEEAGEHHRQRQDCEERPPERQGAESTEPAPTGGRPRQEEAQDEVGAPGDQVPVREVGEAEDRVRERESHRAEGQGRPEQ